jgi:hypothetical protein
MNNLILRLENIMTDYELFETLKVGFSTRSQGMN